MNFHLEKLMIPAGILAGIWIVSNFGIGLIILVVIVIITIVKAFIEEY